MNNKMIDVELSKIDVEENIRMDVKDEAMVQLMESIKQFGLLQPVGLRQVGSRYKYVWGYRRIMAFHKLGFKTVPAIILKEDENLTEEDYLTINIIENIHRKDVTAIELGRACKKLKDLGLTTPEIATRLSLPASRIVTAMSFIGKTFPQKELNNIVFMDSRNGSKKGKISTTTALRIMNMRLSNNANRSKVLAYVKEHSLSDANLRMVEKLVNNGADVDTALRNYEKLSLFHIYLIVDRKEIAVVKSDYKCKSNQEVIYGMLRGKIPLNPSLFKKMRS